MFAKITRQPMSGLVVLCLATAGVALTVVAAIAAVSSAKDVARGKYLVHNVAMCVDCHGENLKGGKLPFKAAVEMPFVQVAPNIRGGVRYTEAQLTKMIMTGKRPNNVPFLPPMPHYNMNKADASAVARYVKSLK